MFRHSVFVAGFVCLLVLAFLHIGGLFYGWYYDFVWLDIGVHALGGAWAASVLLQAAYFRPRQGGYIQRPGLAIAWVSFATLGIGVAWELFEVLIEAQAFESERYLFDTTTDLMADTAGALLLAGFAAMRFRSAQTRKISSTKL